MSAPRRRGLRCCRLMRRGIALLGRVWDASATGASNGIIVEVKNGVGHSAHHAADAGCVRSFVRMAERAPWRWGMGKRCFARIGRFGWRAGADVYDGAHRV